jgi:hypothetical protein
MLRKIMDKEVVVEPFPLQYRPCGWGMVVVVYPDERDWGTLEDIGD